MPLPPDTDAVIGRLLMVGVRGASLEDPRLFADLEACRAAKVKGVVLFDVDLPAAHALEGQGVVRDEARRRATRNIESPEQVRTLCEVVREALGDDALVAVDQEGGRVARLKPERGFEAHPSAEDFGRLDADGRVRAARALARTVAGAGLDVNFAPCVDVAVDPASPVIAGLGRSFSADARLVTACAAAVIDAHHELGVATCLKHFPGHGSAEGDTHAGFVDITRTFDARRELTPFELLLRLPPPGARAGMVMSGHLFHAGLDPEHPASLSRAVTTGLLRDKLGFQGAVVVDSLDMGAITARYGPEEALVLALNAGADVLLDCNNAPGPARACPAPAMAEAVRRALVDGRIEGGVERLRASAARVGRVGRQQRPSPRAEC